MGYADIVSTSMCSLSRLKQAADSSKFSCLFCRWILDVFLESKEEQLALPHRYTSNMFFCQLLVYMWEQWNNPELITYSFRAESPDSNPSPENGTSKVKTLL